ncbi:MAG: succinate dehydrogenase, hydrophobic membrane anchor protein [Pseudomonadota bacterium]
MASPGKTLRTPLSRVRGLGSAGEGTDHFWKQRLTAIANIPLMMMFVGYLIAGLKTDHAGFVAMLSSPIPVALFILMIVSGVYHMRLGMQTIIEDYVPEEGSKLVLLMGNTFFCALAGLVGVISVLMIAFGG